MAKQSIKRSETHVSNGDSVGNQLEQTVAFLSIVVFMGVAGFALYLNHQWFAGIFGMTGLVTIVSIFVTKDDKRKK